MHHEESKVRLSFGIALVPGHLSLSVCEKQTGSSSLQTTLSFTPAMESQLLELPSRMIPRIVMVRMQKQQILNALTFSWQVDLRMMFTILAGWMIPS
jgi:hypothetical protein